MGESGASKQDVERSGVLDNIRVSLEGSRQVVEGFIRHALTIYSHEKKRTDREERGGWRKKIKKR